MFTPASGFHQEGGVGRAGRNRAARLQQVPPRQQVLPDGLNERKLANTTGLCLKA